MTAYYVDNTGLYSSDGRMLLNPTGNQILDWILADKPRENKLFYDLDACVASIIGMSLNEKQARELYEKEKVWIDGYKLTYFPTRFFAIDGSKSFVNFGNMVRYKSDVHYLPEETIEEKLAKAKEAEIIAKEARMILTELGLDPQRIISPVGAVIDKYVWSLRPPTVDDMPEEAGELAYETIKGNWLECYQMGYWDEVYDYDINVAYGSRLQKLLDIRRGTWEESDTMPKNAVYGYASGLLNITKPFHPYSVKNNDDTTNPIGARYDVLPKNMIDLLIKHDLGTFDIKKGLWWIPSDTKPLYEPLRGIITHLQKIRSESIGLKKAILRQIIAGIWGRMVEVRKDKLGQLFNPVWGSEVENGIKCQVTDDCLSAGIIPLQVAVDGVITEKPLPYSDSLEIGKWRLAHKGKCIIASSGVVAFEGKEGAEEFSLRYDWLYEQLKNNPDKSEYKMVKYSPITLAKVMQTEHYHMIGEFQTINRSIVIGNDYKRLWSDLPKCGGDLLNNRYHSLPIDTIMAGGI